MKIRQAVVPVIVTVTLVIAAILMFGAGFPAPL